MSKEVRYGYGALIGLGGIALVLSAAIFFLPEVPVTAFGIGDQNKKEEYTPSPSSKPLTGKHVVVFLDTMMLELRDGTTTLTVLPVLSKGKPGSYYETPGGDYVSDYKVPLHFSSIGHVYMPYSIHLFGNFFIHGVPYYESGEKVSSNYSGGCIRLQDEDIKKVYAFVEKGTVIRITNTLPSVTQGTAVTKEEMTTLMAATISLEFLQQDSDVFYEGEKTTRRALLSRLLSGDMRIARFYANALGERTFVEKMNTKAEAIGLYNTHFSSVTETASTTNTDAIKFYDYLSTHKPFLITH